MGSPEVLMNSSGNDVCNVSLDVMTSYLTPLYESNFLMAIIYCCIVATALLVGTVGNIFILIVSLTTRTMNRVGRDFVINLAVADLCVAAVADPMCILGKISVHLLSVQICLSPH